MMRVVANLTTVSARFNEMSASDDVEFERSSLKSVGCSAAAIQYQRTSLSASYRQHDDKSCGPLLVRRIGNKNFLRFVSIKSCILVEVSHRVQSRVLS